MKLENGLWMGTPLKDYSREELYEIILTIDQMRSRDSEQYMRDLDIFSQMRRPTPLQWLKILLTNNP